MRIIVVDDREEERYLSETLLKGSGYEVVTAVNGAEALEKLRAEDFDMIVSDILMPVMDGFQLCLQCKEDKELKDIPFVFYTAEYIEEGDENLALRMRVDKFIRKPIEPDEFIKLIQGIFRDVEEAKKKPSVAGMKILIVEDNEDSRNLLAKQLRAYGHEVMAAADGAEALEQALAQPPDIIVSDILMPKIDGYRLCHECKQNDKLKDIPFVFYTATYTLDEDKKFALSLGGAAFIRKPAEPDVLVKTLCEVFEKAKSGALASPEVAPLEQSLFLTEHDKRIFAKLEDKVTQLEAEITKRRQAEEEIEHLNRVLCAIRNVNQLIIREKERGKLLKSACDILLKNRSYDSTCICLFDESGMLVTHAEGGLSKDFLTIVERLKRGELTDCIKRTLIQSGVVITKASSLTCGDCPPVKTCSGKKVVTVRMEHGGKVYGLLKLQVAGDTSISREEKSLLQEVTDDIAFALHDMELEEESKRTEEELHRQIAFVRLLEEVAIIANQALSVEDALQLALDLMCTHKGWPVGHVYILAGDSTDKLAPTTIWHLEEAEKFETFRKVTEVTFFTSGAGLPGRVLATGKPAWIVDVTKDPNFPRSKLAKEIGAKAGFAFPVLVGTEVVAVLEFFSAEAEEPDDALLELMRHIGTQLGRVVERKKAEEKLQQSYQVQTLINKLLRRSLEAGSLEELLEQTIDHLTSITWLTLESKGAIFLVEDDPQVLVMKAQRGLPAPLLTMCARVPFGRCLCGRVASSGEIQFADRVDQRHENQYEGISLHGHYCVPMLSAGKVLGVINMYVKEGHHRDEREEEFLRAVADVLAGIVERKRAEEKIKRAAEEWRTTFDSITDLVSICDKDFRLVRVNKAFADVAKMKPEEIIGKHCYEIVHGTKKHLPNCPHKKTIKTKKPATAEIFESHLGMHIELSTSPIFDEKGEVMASIHIIRDITERKKMEEQLIVTDRLASIGELAAGIAHEMNNPLTGVIGFAQLLLEKDVPDDAKEYVKIIYSEAQRTAEVVKNLLAFARKHEPVKQLVNINSIIEKVLELRAYEQKVSNIQVNTHFAPDLPEVMADYFQLQQVFLNIIINAEHFMIEAHRRGTLTITTERTEDIIKASFVDDGPGIFEEDLGHLFDPFFTTKETGKGTGLGLSICYGIVTEHGGRIYAESESGKGATFIVELPISR